MSDTPRSAAACEEIKHEIAFFCKCLNDPLKKPFGLFAPFEPHIAFLRQTGDGDFLMGPEVAQVSHSHNAFSSEDCHILEKQHHLPVEIVPGSRTLVFAPPLDVLDTVEVSRLEHAGKQLLLKGAFFLLIGKAYKLWEGLLDAGPCLKEGHPQVLDAYRAQLEGFVTVYGDRIPCSVFELADDGLGL